MIVCSCNAFSDHQVWSAVAKASRRPRMSQIYDDLGSSPQCGRCAHTIKRIMEQVPNCWIGSVIANANLHTRSQERKLLSESIEKSAPGLLREV
jgi:bacterioferritin-associated ferredoxin